LPVLVESHQLNTWLLPVAVAVASVLVVEVAVELEVIDQT
jgi:hypothetical protein